MPSPPVSAPELRELLGEVDDLILERILETQASLDEVAEALGDVEDEQAFGEQSRIPSSPTVIAVRAILRELFSESETEGELPLVDGDELESHRD